LSVIGSLNGRLKVSTAFKVTNDGFEGWLVGAFVLPNVGVSVGKYEGGDVAAGTGLSVGYQQYAFE
jgi:hypothetical protein